MKSKSIIMFALFIMVTIFINPTFARELTSSVQEMGTTLKDIVLKLAVVFFVIAGAAFMVSMRTGIERVTAAFIGVSVAAGATTLVALAQRLFS